ncbi:MAG: S-methyl-5-thioribose-1-phosphate isomerase [Burkholderiaceae bacterium]
MKINGTPWRSIWPVADGRAVGIVDQTTLPHEFTTLELADWRAIEAAIRDMRVRGAPLIGVTGAYGLALAMRDDASDESLATAFEALNAARPTAVNLRWALERMQAVLRSHPPAERFDVALAEAGQIAEQDVAICKEIGRHGANLIREAHQRLGRPVQILTHCNTGWLAAVDYGTALSAIYQAHDEGVPLHVWVDETRPRNQGLLTAWELAAHGVPHTLIVDNAGGHLMQHGHVDMAIVGADRVSARGDVANKIGTYLKAVAAADCGVPFFVAVPSPTFDWTLADGLKEIEIETRCGKEVRFVAGLDAAGKPAKVAIASGATHVSNPAFDVTPHRLVTAIISERGACAPADLHLLYPERICAL